jgi:YD repeat-containing protein
MRRASPPPSPTRSATTPTFVYDANGNVTSNTDADGRTTQTTYDADDQPTAVERGDGSKTHTA